MLLDNLTYAQITTLVDDACRQAILLSNNAECDLLVKSFDQLNSAQISLSDWIGGSCDKSDLVTKIICQLTFIRSVLVDMLFCLKKTNEYYRKQFTLKLNRKMSLKKISVGINGMPTEYLDHNVTIKLHTLLTKLEQSDSIEGLAQFVADILSSREGNEKKHTNIDTQLFYADNIYFNFDAIYTNIFETNQALDIDNEQLPCIRLYTWVGGDQDGIPFTTSTHTETALNAFSERIKSHYHDDLNAILKKHNDIKLKRVSDLLEVAESPNEIISILSTYDYANHPDIYLLNLKLKSFGFHYIELEFRENSRVIHEAMDQIIEKNIINDILSINKSYRELSEDERDFLLTRLMSNAKLPARLINHFFSSNADYFKLKSNEYAGRSVYDLHEMDHAYLLKYNAKRFLEWFYTIKKYPQASDKFGVAEAKSRTDALAVLFCAKGVLGSQHIHVILQPEGPVGAEALYATIEVLYQNEIYIAHLKNNQNRQYITFGPSDICKQGGKGMHFLNMQLANMHRIIARKYDIELIASVIIGHEHARCNNVFIENLNEFGVNQGDEIRYMMAGLNEMRHLILTPLMTKNFFKALYDFQFLSLNDRAKDMGQYQGRFDFWIKSVRAYENTFFNHPHLPTFLKEVARLDVIKYVTKDHRPQSRKYWLECAEIDPSQIRAVAWTRSLLLSGLHFEWLGAEVWSDQSVAFLNNKFKHDVAFCNYIKSIAYACARTNISMTWRALGCESPLSLLELAATVQSNLNDSKQFLATIHMSFLKSLQLVIKSVYKRDLQLAELFDFDRISLLEYWPDLAEEVMAREKRLDEYYKVILDRKHEDKWLLNRNILMNLYSAFINESNTAISYYLTADDKAFPLLKQV